MTMIRVRLHPAQSARVQDEVARAREDRPIYHELMLRQTSVYGTAAALRALAEGIESTFDEDIERMKIDDKVDDNRYREVRTEFGLARARASVEKLVEKLRKAAGPEQPYDQLGNRSMARALEAGEAIDLSGYRQEDGTYLLPSDLDIESKDLCDATPGIENWVWSVGKNAQTGERRAALDDRFYGQKGWSCEWLR